MKSDVSKFQNFHVPNVCIVTLVPFFFLYTALTASPAALQNIRAAAVAGPVQLLSITVNPGKASLHLVQ